MEEKIDQDHPGIVYVIIIIKTYSKRIWFLVTLYNARRAISASLTDCLSDKRPFPVLVAIINRRAHARPPKSGESIIQRCNILILYIILYCIRIETDINDYTKSTSRTQSNAEGEKKQKRPYYMNGNETREAAGI